MAGQDGAQGRNPADNDRARVMAEGNGGPGATQEGPAGRRLFVLCLTALGVVYGDIGTSPLYAIRECFSGVHGLPVTAANVLGVLSLILWSLVVVITVKYLTFVLRADNGGEGGILALMSLARPEAAHRKRPGLLVVLGLFGGALLYGDGMITPAISVLSSIEGLEVATPFFEPWIVPITIVILVLLFAFQGRGTTRIGAVFGPVTLVWFLVLSILGVAHIAREPSVLAAVLPTHAIDFFVRNGWMGFTVLGAVFLVVTGGEALYADMGHFGLRPIRLTWFWLVLPALLLNYFGQGGLLLAHPEAAQNPFYRMAPSWALYPLVGLAALATVIASQAVISGAFSLTMQAVQLGFLPRVRIAHTSASERGQIYVPRVNWLLMLASVGLVLGFGTSGNLAAAYGVAVTTTMVITTILFCVVAVKRWGWRVRVVAPLTAVFLIVDLAFFGANILKIPHGGWFPLVIAAAVYTLMSTWRRGRRMLAERLRASATPFEDVLDNLQRNPPHRVRGTAIFMTGNPWGTPPAFLHNLKHNQVVHQQVLLLNVVTDEISHVPRGRRLELEDLGNGFFRAVAHYGFMDSPDVNELIGQAAQLGLHTEPDRTTWFLGRERIVSAKRRGPARARDILFAYMVRNAQGATAFFHIPPERVIEIGAQIAV